MTDSFDVRIHLTNGALPAGSSAATQHVPNLRARREAAVRAATNQGLAPPRAWLFRFLVRRVACEHLYPGVCMAAPEPQATAAGSYTPILTDATRLARVLVSPRAVFDEQREKPTWFLPWLVVAIIVIVIGIFQTPYTMRTIELALEARGSTAQVPAGAMHTQAMIGSIVTPIFFLIFGAIGAGILYLILAVTGSSVRYRAMLSATIFSQAVLPIQFILQAVILRLRGAPDVAISSIADAQPGLGLNLLLSADATSSHFLTALLGGIGPLPIWALIITAVGIMRLDKVKTGAAWTAALGSYVVLLLVAAGLASLQR